MLPSFEHVRVEIGLESAERLACQDIELHRDQRAVRRIKNLVRLGGADQFVADVTPRVVDAHDLGILDVRIVDLAVARLDLRPDRSGIEHVRATELVHGGDEILQIVADDEVRAFVPERLDRCRTALGAGAADHLPPAFAGEIRILFGAGKTEFLLDDALRQDEPRIVVARAHDVLELTERVVARIER